ncbi:MAG: polysaccharide deacetylase family protein [Thiothrix sp.]|nr:polysaccharide deacetylase family protein [Thiothrix sp.]HPE58919.1 polysaccharide deacetylase family protein [Thiolinea sp.]
MAYTLGGSVGQDGENRPEDVITVYTLLNRILLQPLPVSDQVTEELILGIITFQEGFLFRPDGRIDVGGRTWRELLHVVEAAEREEIGGSVGEGGDNHPQDVRIVYALFNELLSRPLAVSDAVTDELIRAIRDLQRPFMAHPDGRIDVGGRTWQRLTGKGGTGKSVKSVLLSFDDGPEPTGALYAILDVLARHDIRAEFYVLGQEVDANPAAVRAIAERGHAVQNHSYSHINLARAGKSTVRREIRKTQESIERATGISPTRIRPPYGAGGWAPYDAELAAVAQEYALQIQNWDIDTEDWRSPRGIGPHKLAVIERQFQQRQHQTEFNVLMHVLGDTAADLEEFIQSLKLWGFDFARP